MLKDLVSHKRTWERTACRTVAQCLWTCSIFTRKVSIVNARIEVQLMKKWSTVPCRNAEISWNQIKRPLFASVCLAVVQPVFSSTSWVYGASFSHEPTACDHTQLFCYFRNWMKLDRIGESVWFRSRLTNKLMDQSDCKSLSSLLASWTSELGQPDQGIVAALLRIDCHFSLRISMISIHYPCWYALHENG